MMDFAEKQRKIEQLRRQIAVCTRCPLHQTRTNTVPGEGNVDADIMFIGEAPGRNEDLQGKPFVGRAGEVFERLLQSVGITRDQIYLCNILKCRPPGNRNPLSSEIRMCVGSLDIQIKVVNPKIIGTLGNFATIYIFEKFNIPPAKIGSVAGKRVDVDTPFGHEKIARGDNFRRLWSLKTQRNTNRFDFPQINKGKINRFSAPSKRYPFLRGKKIVPVFHPAVATYDSHKIDLLLKHFQVFKHVCPTDAAQTGKMS